jgi:hypothetical protein
MTFRILKEEFPKKSLLYTEKISLVTIILDTTNAFALF